MAIYQDIQITVNQGLAQPDKSLYIFRGDSNIILNFKLVTPQYKLTKEDKDNLVTRFGVDNFELRLQLEKGYDRIIRGVITEDGYCRTQLTQNVIQELRVGTYSYQITLIDDDDNAIMTFPICKAKFNILDRMSLTAEELAIPEGLSGEAMVDLSLIVDNGEVLEAFDRNGNYIKTNWGPGDVISASKLNKIEEGIDGVNKKAKQLHIEKFDKNGILSMANMGQDVKEAMTGGSVAVVGENAILTNNILDGQVTPHKTSFMNIQSTNLIKLQDATYKANGVDITIKNNQITIDGTTTGQTWLKITNTQELRTSSSIGWDDWMSETAYEYEPGRTYSTTILEVKGTISREVNTALKISARDKYRNTVFGTSLPTITLTDNIAYIQFFLEEKTTYNNYTVIPVVVEGSVVPINIEDLPRYQLIDQVAIPTADKNNIDNNTKLSNDNANRIDRILYTQGKILESLRDNGVEIDIVEVENKIKGDRYVRRFHSSGLTIDVAEDGMITINGTPDDNVYLKLSNGYDISIGSSGGSKQSQWAKESVMDILTVGNKYFSWVHKVGGSVTPRIDSVGFGNIIISARSASYISVCSQSQHGLVEMTESASYIQVYLPSELIYNNLEIYCGFYENYQPETFILDKDDFVFIKMPKQVQTVGDYPTSVTAVHKIDIPGKYMNAIQGACVYGHYLYCGVVNNSDDTGNTTLHRIDLDTWEIVESKTEFSVGHCNGMAYCDYDGYIHCIGLESFQDYKRVHRITTNLEYVDSYIIDISPYYPESTGIGSVVYNPHTEEFLFQIRGNKKGYARYTKNLTFIDILWTDNMSKTNSVYGGFDCDRNFIYQAIWDGSNNNRLCIFDYKGNTLLDANISGMSGEVEGIALYKNKLIAVSNKLTYDNHNLFEVTLSDFRLYN